MKRVARCHCDAFLAPHDSAHQAAALLGTRNRFTPCPLEDSVCLVDHRLRRCELAKYCRELAGGALVADADQVRGERLHPPSAICDCIECRALGGLVRLHQLGGQQFDTLEDSDLRGPGRIDSLFDRIDLDVRTLDEEALAFGSEVALDVFLAGQALALLLDSHSDRLSSSADRFDGIRQLGAAGIDG